jgi:hypothetical protein
MSASVQTVIQLAGASRAGAANIGTGYDLGETKPDCALETLIPHNPEVLSGK